MKYLGGKYRIAKDLRAAMEPYLRAHGYQIWEPFCGGLNFSRVLTGCTGVLSDKHPALIALYRAYRNGWEPPPEVTREMYERARRLPDSNPLKAFVGFGNSFSGKWFSSYTGDVVTRPHHERGKQKRMITERLSAATTRSLAPLRAELAGFKLARVDFLRQAPRHTPALIYCDPPYYGTTGYGEHFDHARFWALAKQWARHTTVLVSEYRCPVSHELVWSRARVRQLTRTAATDDGARVEKLVRVLPSEVAR